MNRPPHCTPSHRTPREWFDAALEQDDPSQWLASHCQDPDILPQVLALLGGDRHCGLLDGSIAEAVEKLGEPAAPTQPGSLIGTRIGAFRLTSLLGQGGMATVFVGQREGADFSQRAAVKLLRRGLFSATEQCLFRRERQALAALSHPNIARLIDGGITEAGIPYLVMEYVEGVPLTRYARERSLDLRSRLSLFLTVCRAVEAAHRAMIVHRDLKPSNLLVDARGQVKLLDFGIAKLLDEDEPDSTRTVCNALTPDYAAPEQFFDGAVSAATDVYALGVVLHELLLGTRPEPRSLRKPSANPLIDPALRRSLRGDLDNILQKAYAAEPHRRYASAGALADDIQNHLDGRPVDAHPASRWYRIGKFVRRHRVGVAAGASIALALSIGLGVSLWQADIARHEATRANATKDFLIRMFKASDPTVASDRPRGQITARELLDRNTPLIAEEFADDPDTQSDLLGIASSIYSGLGEHARGKALRAQQTALARKTYGPYHEVVIDNLLTDAQHESDVTMNYAKARQLIEQADGLIHRAGLDESEFRARWWLIRGASRRPDASAAQQMLSDLQTSVRLYEQFAPRHRQHVTALYYLSGVQAQADMKSAADSLRSAIALSESIQPRGDADLVNMYSALGQAQEELGDLKGADRSYQRMTVIARATRGEQHYTYWVGAAVYARMLHRQGLRERSLAEFKRLFEVIPAQWTMNNAADNARELYAASLIAEGRADEAIPLLEAAERRYRASPMMQHDTRRVRGYLGLAYATAGRTELARERLKQSLDEYAKFEPPNALRVLMLREAWGRLVLEPQDPAGAEAQYREIVARAGDRADSPISLAHAGLARIALARGDAASALESSRKAVDLFTSFHGDTDVRTGPKIWLVRSQALRLAGDTQSAAQWAQRALDASSRYDAPSAASIAQARAALHEAVAGNQRVDNQGLSKQGAKRAAASVGVAAL